MAKKTVVKITGVNQARTNALEFINKQSKDPDFLKGLGEEAAFQIASAVRSKGRTDPAYFQPPLEDSTIERRKTLIKQGNSFNAKIVTPKGSNLSMSGQLLDAIKSRVNYSISTIVLFLKPQRSPYKGKSGQPLESKTNNEIKKELESKGFRFFFLSDKISILLENLITKQLRRKLALYNRINRKLK